MEADDWETDFAMPTITTEKQSKRLEEQKMVEEADKELAIDLFSTEKKELSDKSIVPIIPLRLPKIKVYSNQKKNEEKQKQRSKLVKERDEKKRREADLFGAATEDDEYADYENKLYSL
jgi:hypothetical protein